MDEPCCTVCRLGGAEPSVVADDRPLLRAEPHEVIILAGNVGSDGRPAGPALASHRPTTSWVTFGRAKDCHLVLVSDVKLSRNQGAFHFRDGLVFVVDTRSACGTLLDGVPVLAEPLREGSIVSVGDTALRIERTPG